MKNKTIQVTNSSSVYDNTDEMNPKLIGTKLEKVQQLNIGMEIARYAEEQGLDYCNVVAITRDTFTVEFQIDESEQYVFKKCQSGLWRGYDEENRVLTDDTYQFVICAK